jgi:hypothetical protein
MASSCRKIAEKGNPLEIICPELGRSMEGQEATVRDTWCPVMLLH